MSGISLTRFHMSIGHRERRLRPLVGVGVLWLVVAGVLAVGSAGWWLMQRVTEQEIVGEPVTFTVSEEDDVEAIGARLEASGIISDAGVFSWYVGQKGGLEPEPGLYRLVPGSHLGEVLGVSVHLRARPIAG